MLFSTNSGTLSRRNFLGKARTTVLGGLLLNSNLVSSVQSTLKSTDSKKYPIGLELYSVRGELSRDLPSTLRNVAMLGYEVVEFFAPYSSWTFSYAREVKLLLDDLGLKCFSTHNHFQSLIPGSKTMVCAIQLNQILGANTIIMASPPSTTHTIEDWKYLCGQLSLAVAVLRSHGLSAGFHNHSVEWKLLETELRAIDILAAYTPHDFVLQLDVGTCMKAGADPVAWIKANPGRIRSVHLKDWAPGSKVDEKDYRVLFTEGVSPWLEIFNAVESIGGVEYYLIEQEGSRYSELETARRCLENWHTVRKTNS